MRRVAVIGNAAGGKSTLARALASVQGLPYHEVDAILWRPGWSAVPEADYDARHEAIVSQETWVLDGFGSWDSVTRRFDRADTIVLVDLPLWVHFWWAAERQMAWVKGEPGEVPAGHDEPPPTEELFKLIWDLDQESMPRLRQMVAEAEQADKFAYWLRDINELAAFRALTERQ